VRLNRVKANCSEGRVSTGTFVNFSDPLSAQILATCGFDWLIVDMEHGPIPLAAAQAAITAIRTTATEPFVRVAWNEPSAIQRVLDSGASGIMVPMVSTAAQARAVVRETCYPPRGERSRGGARGPLSFDTDAPTYFGHADDAIFVMAQIETAEAIRNLEEIAAVDGIDCLFVGPNDLAAAYGFDYPGGWERMSGPYTEAIDQVVAVARAAGKSAGFQATSAAIANDCIARGYTVVGVTTDVTMLARAARAERTALRLPGES
jgi:4-hydroxy-2-oxoheptanedioate aldolase